MGCALPSARARHPLRRAAACSSEHAIASLPWEIDDRTAVGYTHPGLGGRPCRAALYWAPCVLDKDANTIQGRHSMGYARIRTSVPGRHMPSGLTLGTLALGPLRAAACSCAERAARQQPARVQAHAILLYGLSGGRAPAARPCVLLLDSLWMGAPTAWATQQAEQPMGARWAAAGKMAGERGGHSGSRPHTGAAQLRRAEIALWQPAGALDVCWSKP